MMSKTHNNLEYYPFFPAAGSRYDGFFNTFSQDGSNGIFSIFGGAVDFGQNPLLRTGTDAMSFSVWLQYLAAVSVLIATPGPAVALVAAHGKLPLKFPLWTIAGGNAASLLLLLAAIVGLGQLEAYLDSGWIRRAGGGYLLYVAVRQYSKLNLNRNSVGSPCRTTCTVFGFAALSRFKFNRLYFLETGRDGTTAVSANHNALSCFGKAFAAGISNPKDILFFASLLSYFLSKPSAQIGMWEAVLLATWCVADWLIMLLYLYIFRKQGALSQEKLNLAGSLSIAVVGVLLLWK